MGKILWLLPIFGAIIGALIILTTMMGASSAPQEAAGYAMACAFAVVPYVLVRAVMAMTDAEWAGDLKSIAHSVEKLARDKDRNAG